MRTRYLKLLNRRFTRFFNISMIAGLIGFISMPSIIAKDCKIKIEHVADLKGDYDFSKKWDYPEDIFRNEFGQLTCEEGCAERTESMKAPDGRIYADSLASFYKLVDTVHRFHSIECEAWCYEWAGTNYITAKSNDEGIICFTHTNRATHCKLILEINDEFCIPKIELNSIVSDGIRTYYCKGGFFRIDEKFLKQGILKAEFDLDFENTDEPDKDMYWKGKIYTKIEQLKSQ